MKKILSISKFGVLALGILYGLVETVYFGNNLFPKSDAEVIADGIAILICSIGLLKFYEKDSI